MQRLNNIYTDTTKNCPPIFFGGQFPLKNKEATIRKLC
ncbi:hypothetical protein CU002_2511 [Enterococcus faecium]|nr:hypothetical protein [Enterococcus faecium]